MRNAVRTQLFLHEKRYPNAVVNRHPVAVLSFQEWRVAVLSFQEWRSKRLFCWS